MRDYIDDIDRQEIARLVREGFTSGRLDNKDGRTIYWYLKLELETDLLN